MYNLHVRGLGELVLTRFHVGIAVFFAVSTTMEVFLFLDGVRTPGVFLIHLAMFGVAIICLVIEGKNQRIKQLTEYEE